MIYPGTYDITVLQNSTWKEAFRLSDFARPVSLDNATATFTCPCHKLAANDKVYFTPSSSRPDLPCGIEPTVVYYVIRTGLTSDEFKVSASIRGASITPHGSDYATFSFSRPLNLTSYVIDTDVKDPFSSNPILSLATAFIDPANGLIELSLSATATQGLGEGTYTYDSSLTLPNGERYYWLSGVVTVLKTFSRN